MILIYISLMTNNVEIIFTSLFAILTLLWQDLFKSLHILKRFISFIIYYYSGSLIYSGYMSIIRSILCKDFLLVYG